MAPEIEPKLVWIVLLAVVGIFILSLLYHPRFGRVGQVSAAGGIPTTSAIVINYNDNVKTVTLTFDEAVKTTTAATNNFDLTKLHLRDTLGGADLVDLSGNTITQTASSTTVTITLTEAQRAVLIAKSATAGGDAGEVVVYMEAAAAYSGATDVANISGQPILAAAVSETADTNAPTISSIATASGGTASVSFTESVVVTFSENVAAGGVTYTASPSTGVTWTARSQSSTVVALGPDQSLPGGTTITLTITAAPDLAGVAVDTTSNASLTFTVQPGGGGASAPAGGSSATVAVSAPSNAQVTINSGAALTNTQTVSLALSAGNSPTQMMFSNSADFANASWMAFAAAYTWSVTEGNGTKTVYAKFKNAGGTSSVATDSITLDVYATIPPAVTQTPAAETPAGEEETPAAETPAGEQTGSASNAHSEGTLVFGADGRTVYRVEGGQLYAFRSAQEFHSYGYDFASVVSASSDDLLLPLAGVRTAAAGSLIKAEDDATVWLVGENGAIRPFPSLSVFTRLGYKLADIMPVPDLSGYIGGLAME